MKGLHIAIFNVPVATIINPTLSIVATLVRRGCRVTYVTSDRYAAEVSMVGAEVVLCPRFGLPFDPTDVFEFASETLSIVSEFYRQNRPTMVLHDSAAFAGLIIAEKLGIRSIRLMPQLAFTEENIAGFATSVTLLSGFRKYLDQVGTFLRSYEIYRSDAVYSRDGAVIYCYSRELQLDQDRVDGDSLYAGRCPAERPWVGAKKEIESVDVGALVSTSSNYVQGPRYYRLCMDALSKLRKSAILAIGSNFDSRLLSPVPMRFEIVQGIPQVVLMRQANLIICHGGMATTMEAMYHGLPLVMITHGNPELEAYAENVERHGLGVHIRGSEPSVEDIVTGILAVERECVSNAVRRMQSVVRKNAGGEEAANWIEDHL